MPVWHIREESVMASFSVVSNISASNAQANLGSTSIGLQKAITRLSSGYRINQSGDDAAGLAVANSYRSQQAVLSQGIRNANDGLSALQIQDGALSNVSTLLDRLSTLATQAASESATVDRNALNDEFQDVLTEIDREVAGLVAEHHRHPAEPSAVCDLARAVAEREREGRREPHP
jgi:flagellin